MRRPRLLERRRNLSVRGPQPPRARAGKACIRSRVGHGDCQDCNGEKHRPQSESGPQRRIRMPMLAVSKRPAESESHLLTKPSLVGDLPTARFYPVRLSRSTSTARYLYRVRPHLFVIRSVVAVLYKGMSF